MKSTKGNLVAHDNVGFIYRYLILSFFSFPQVPIATVANHLAISAVGPNLTKRGTYQASRKAYYVPTEYFPLLP